MLDKTQVVNVIRKKYKTYDLILLLLVAIM